MVKKKQSLNDLLGAVGFLQSGGKGMFGGLAPVLGTGKRATILGSQPSHGTPMKYASLTGGKKLVMTGVDKGKII
jgi:hypothetical protein